MKKDLFQEQIDIELEIRDNTIDRFEKITTANKVNGLESFNVYGTALMKKAIAPLSKAIKDKIKDAEKGGVGRRSSCVGKLKLFKADDLAYHTIRTIMNSLTDTENKITAIQLKVAKEALDDLMLQEFKKVAPRLHKQQLSRYKTVNSRARRMAIYKRTFKNWLERNNGNSVVNWSKSERTHFGTALIDLCIASTGLVEIRKKWVRKNHSENLLVPTEKVKQFIEDSQAYVQLNKPMYQPMVCPPLDWTDTTSGGYLSTDIPQMNLMKTSDRAYLEKLDSDPEKLKDVFNAVNVLQRTPWRINTFVLDTYKELRKLDLAIAGLPPFDTLPAPVSPFGINKDTKNLTRSEEEEFKKWKKKKKAHHEDEIKLRSKRSLCSKIEGIAEKFKGYEEIFFPKNLDFRGRIYDAPLHLNPQGNSLSKGLLLFANGEPIGDETAVTELAIHGANCFGMDKLGFTGRYEWVLDNHDLIIKTAEDPIGNLWWAKEADCPWTFLAFCKEWHGVTHDNYEHITYLPIQKDATCSGLQHFSGALKDEIGGNEVNLLVSDRPADIYKTVANKTIDKLTADLQDSDKAEMAQRWLDYGINRKTCKRATMVRVYGSTLYSSRKFVTEFIEDTDLKRTEQNPHYVSIFKDPELSFKASLYLAEHIWNSINESVLAAPRCMDWLQSIAETMAREGLTVEWNTIDGLPIKQQYPCYRSRRIKTVMGDSLVYQTLREKKYSDKSKTKVKLDTRKQANGISPNWVHANDGCHLRMTINLASEGGLKNFSFIHDSFGTLATDIGRLAYYLRETFIRLYDNYDTLELFRTEQQEKLDSEGVDITLPPVPPKGNLDLHEIHQSDFFFS